MSKQIRAKFQCQSETKYGWNESKTFKFQAMYDPDLPEDQRFAKATPSGTLEILVDNPTAQFEVGAYYYLDFTRVED
jgi:hypothetical protein